jgi:hypothetical protein
MISADRVRQLLSYDPETGVFMWRERGMRRQLNRPITCKRRGYVHVTIAYKNYPAHQLAWLYVHNEWTTALQIFGWQRGLKTSATLPRLAITNRGTRASAGMRRLVSGGLSLVLPTSKYTLESSRIRKRH